MTTRLKPHNIDPESATQGNTLAVTAAGRLAYVEASVPCILLPAGSDATDVPTGTPVGTIVLVKD